MKKLQINLIKFAVKHPDHWHSYYPNKATTEVVCATANLGIIKVNEFDQFTLKSLEKANRFLNS